MLEGKCQAIFPEGGSHDRTDIIPIKAGVAIFTLGAMDKYKVNTRVQCAGLNYHSPHKYRSVVVIEYGRPYTIDQEDLVKYKDHETKREVISTFQETLTKRIRDVKTVAKNYEDILNIHLARSLYIADEVVPVNKLYRINCEFIFIF